MNCYNVVRLFSYNHPEINLETEIAALKAKSDDVASATHLN
ncbi:hypothetical protein [Candidatus Brocadia sinica]|nr:hypothetical protein [Candidatus Brocadia sinica]